MGDGGEISELISWLAAPPRYGGRLAATVAAAWERSARTEEAVSGGRGPESWRRQSPIAVKSGCHVRWWNFDSWLLSIRVAVYSAPHIDEAVSHE